MFGISIKIREFETDTLQIWNKNAELSGSAKVSYTQSYTPGVHNTKDSCIQVAIQ